ncbi:MAG: glucose-6-phosphate dehydrogenase (NADP(+)) [Chitinispirillales bacterium]|jgi:glucose-6-phosphate 1-dehydrogenase|nr:glucose-6-phosphate dehydrogenase (NADP(+)) [Chitinispirillales bacterium]
MALCNCAIVILGASGDLTGRKLMPALSTLFKQGQIDRSSIIVGSGRTFFTDEEFRNRFEEAADFGERLFYHQYISGLWEFIASKGNFTKKVVFLSQPPSAYESSARELVEDGFGSETSIVLEKPFGYDYSSAVKLNNALLACFNEKQIYRIDHYLGKEAVQNILVFRFANSLFYPQWNSRYIESIQINALESEGVAARGKYFDGAGIIRDMVQNHLLQLLCLLTMEAPVTLDAEDIREQKISVLRSMEILSCNRFQYEGYKSEKGVSAQSGTETFAELALRINNFRWLGTPVYIRTGKATYRKGTEIGVRFRHVPEVLYNKQGSLKPNTIIFNIQPNEGITLDLSTKIPGGDNSVAAAHMNLCYRKTFGAPSPEAYQKLIYDALTGDRTLFVSALETETAWRLVDDILDKGSVETYQRGSLPQSKFDLKWIDFDSYGALC